VTATVWNFWRPVRQRKSNWVSSGRSWLGGVPAHSKRYFLWTANPFQPQAPLCWPRASQVSRGRACAPANRNSHRLADCNRARNACTARLAIGDDGLSYCSWLHCSFAYSALACYRMGMSGSAFLHTVKKFLRVLGSSAPIRPRTDAGTPDHRGDKPSQDRASPSSPVRSRPQWPV